MASACVLQAKVYLFCGMKGNMRLNSIEMISESSLFPQSTARWELVEVPKNILKPHANPAVVPINDTEIAIFGGFYIPVYDQDSEVVVFNTTTNQGEKMSAGDKKFYVIKNQCAQAGHNKVVALAWGKDNNKPAVITWTKGAKAIIILDRLEKKSACTIY